MRLQRYEFKLGFFKGLLVGIRHYSFEDDNIYEEDIVLYFGMIQLIITKIYHQE